MHLIDFQLINKKDNIFNAILTVTNITHKQDINYSIQMKNNDNVIHYCDHLYIRKYSNITELIMKQYLLPLERRTQIRFFIIGSGNVPVITDFRVNIFDLNNKN